MAGFPIFESFVRAEKGHAKGWSPATNQFLGALQRVENGQIQRDTAKRDLVAIQQVGSWRCQRVLANTPVIQQAVSGYQWRALQLAMARFGEIPLREQLVFHGLHPDLYLFQSRHRDISRAPKQLLFVFGSKLNTLNVHRAFGHLFLTDALDMTETALVYVGNRSYRDASKGFVGATVDQTTHRLGRLIALIRPERVVGLGVSLGGYVGYRYATRLGFSKFLNFSGAPPDLSVDLSEASMQGLAESQVLSVLSETNDVDKAIYQWYKRVGFSSEYDFISDDVHGSFTVSVLNNKLQGYLKWLIA